MASYTTWLDHSSSSYNACEAADSILNSMHNEIGIAIGKDGMNKDEGAVSVATIIGDEDLAAELYGQDLRSLSHAASSTLSQECDDLTITFAGRPIDLPSFSSLGKYGTKCAASSAQVAIAFRKANSPPSLPPCRVPPLANLALPVLQASKCMVYVFKRNIMSKMDINYLVSQFDEFADIAIKYAARERGSSSSSSTSAASSSITDVDVDVDEERPPFGNLHIVVDTRALGARETTEVLFNILQLEKLQPSGTGTGAGASARKHLSNEATRRNAVRTALQTLFTSIRLWNMDNVQDAACRREQHVAALRQALVPQLREKVSIAGCASMNLLVPLTRCIQRENEKLPLIHNLHVFRTNEFIMTSMLLAEKHRCLAAYQDDAIKTAKNAVDTIQVDVKMRDVNENDNENDMSSSIDSSSSSSTTILPALPYRLRSGSYTVVHDNQDARHACFVKDFTSKKVLRENIDRLMELAKKYVSVKDGRDNLLAELEVVVEGGNSKSKSPARAKNSSKFSSTGKAAVANGGVGKAEPDGAAAFTTEYMNFLQAVVAKQVIRAEEQCDSIVEYYKTHVNTQWVPASAPILSTATTNRKRATTSSSASASSSHALTSAVSVEVRKAMTTALGWIERTSKGIVFAKSNGKQDAAAAAVSSNVGIGQDQLNLLRNYVKTQFALLEKDVVQILQTSQTSPPSFIHPHTNSSPAISSYRGGVGGIQSKEQAVDFAFKTLKEELKRVMQNLAQDSIVQGLDAHGNGKYRVPTGNVLSYHIFHILSCFLLFLPCFDMLRYGC